MGCLGNILWILFGGLAVAIEYFTAGIALCVTIIGIPFGKQHFKLMSLAFWPFGKQVQ